MKKNILSIFGVCYFAYLFTSSYLSSTEVKLDEKPSHFVQFSNLNFEFKNGSHLIRSGPTGNIYEWSASFVDPEKRKISKQTSRTENTEANKNIKKQKKDVNKTDPAEKFDVNKIHQQLEKCENEIRKEWGKRSTDNIVTAAITLILKKEDEDKDYYAVTYPLTKDIETKNQGKTKQQLIFISGTEGREIPYYIDAKTYSLSILLENAIRRKDNEVFKNNDLKNIFETIESIQKEKNKEALLILENAKDILEMEEYLKTFDKRSKLVSQDTVYKRTGGYGPVADSEQFLIHYLENELIQVDKDLNTPKGQYINWWENYIDEQYKYLKSEYSVHDYKKTIEAQAAFDQGIKLAQNVNDVTLLGAFLHLFSTRELCHFCATSLIDEFYYKDENFVSRLKNDIKQRQINNEGDHLPFFVVFSSYRETVDEATHILRPKGTISARLYRTPQENEINKESDLITLVNIIQGKLLPLLPLKKDTA